MLLTSQSRAEAIDRLKKIEDDIAEVRRISGWPEYEAARPRFRYGNYRFNLTYSTTSFGYAEAEIHPLELASHFMLEIAHEFESNLKELHTLVEHELDPVLLDVADVHLDLGRGKLFTFLLTPNNPDILQAPDRETVHWLAQYELAGEWDFLTCTYIKNSEVLTVPLPDLAVKIARIFNDVLANNLTP